MAEESGYTDPNYSASSEIAPVFGQQPEPMTFDEFLGQAAAYPEFQNLLQSIFAPPSQPGGATAEDAARLSSGLQDAGFQIPVPQGIDQLQEPDQIQDVPPIEDTPTFSDLGTSPGVQAPEASPTQGGDFVDVSQVVPEGQMPIEDTGVGPQVTTADATQSIPAIAVDEQAAPQSNEFVDVSGAVPTGQMPITQTQGGLSPEDLATMEPAVGAVVAPAATSTTNNQFVDTSASVPADQMPVFPGPEFAAVQPDLAQALGFDPFAPPPESTTTSTDQGGLIQFGAPLETSGIPWGGVDSYIQSATPEATPFPEENISDPSGAGFVSPSIATNPNASDAGAPLGPPPEDLTPTDANAPLGPPPEDLVPQDASAPLGPSPGEVTDPTVEVPTEPAVVETPTDQTPVDQTPTDQTPVDAGVPPSTDNTGSGDVIIPIPAIPDPMTGGFGVGAGPGAGNLGTTPAGFSKGYTPFGGGDTGPQTISYNLGGVGGFGGGGRWATDYMHGGVDPFGEGASGGNFALGMGGPESGIEVRAAGDAPDSASVKLFNKAAKAGMGVDEFMAATDNAQPGVTKFQQHASADPFHFWDSRVKQSRRMMSKGSQAKAPIGLAGTMDAFYFNSGAGNYKGWTFDPVAGTFVPPTPPAGLPPAHLARGGRVRRPEVMRRMSGKVPGRDTGVDKVHTLLKPGEVVFNVDQLPGIQIRDAKRLRPDQIKAIQQARRGKKEKVKGTPRGGSQQRRQSRAEFYLKMAA